MLGRGKKDHARLLMPTQNHLNLVMHIVIEGPDLKEVNFNPVQRSEPSQSYKIVTISGGGGGESQGAPTPV